MSDRFRPLQHLASERVYLPERVAYSDSAHPISLDSLGSCVTRESIGDAPLTQKQAHLKWQHSNLLNPRRASRSNICSSSAPTRSPFQSGSVEKVWHPLKLRASCLAPLPPPSTNLFLCLLKAVWLESPQDKLSASGALSTSHGKVRCLLVEITSG